MDFVLRYAGSLPSAQGNDGSTTKAAARIAIRKAVHDQLTELWTLDPLDHRRTHWGGIPTRAPTIDAGDGRRVFGAKVVPEQELITVTKADRQFVPIVCRRWRLLARVDVMLLARGDGDSAFHESDIDNRVKFLLDALAVPKDSVMTDFVGSKFPRVTDASPIAPIFTVFEDDRLLQSYSVEKLRLLAGADGDHAEVVLRVHTFPSRVTMGNLGL